MKKIITLSFLLFTSNFSFAQTEILNAFYGQFGLGLSAVKFSKGDVGLNITGSINYMNDNSVYSIGYLKSEELIIFAEPVESITSVDFKYGRVHDLYQNSFLFILKLGISYNQLTERTDKIITDELFNTVYYTKRKSGYGLPLEIGVQINGFKYLGVYTSVYANLNGIKFMYGFNTTVCVGLLW